MWIGRHFAANPFERYADDIIVHCNSKAEAEHLLVSIRERLAGFGLELHPEKTKLVYCKSWKRKEQHEHNSFTLLSYSFNHAASRILLAGMIGLRYLVQQFAVKPKPL